MTLQSTVVANNPNLIGATTLPGTFNVFYKDDLLGTAGVRPLTIPGRGSTNLTVDVSIKGVSPIMGMRMVQELLDNKYQLRLSVQGFVTACVGPLRAKAHAECDLRADISPFLHLSEQQEELARVEGTFPSTEFSERKCAYS